MAQMICADFLAGANLDGSDPDLLLKTQLHYFTFLSSEQQARFMAEASATTAIREYTKDNIEEQNSDRSMT